MGKGNPVKTNAGGEGRLTSTGAQVHTGGLWRPSSQEPAVLEAFLEQALVSETSQLGMGLISCIPAVGVRPCAQAQGCL